MCIVLDYILTYRNWSIVNSQLGTFFLSLLFDFPEFEQVVFYNTMCSNTDFLSTVSFYK